MWEVALAIGFLQKLGSPSRAPLQLVVRIAGLQCVMMQPLGRKNCNFKGLQSAIASLHA